MSLLIISRNKPSTVNYYDILKDLNLDITMLTKEEFIDYLPNDGENIGYKNFDFSDLPYIDAIKISKNKEINCLLAIHEFDLVKAGRIRDYLEIEGQNEESATAFRDKVVMKDLASTVIKTPKYQRVENIIDIVDFIETNGYPVIIKPVDGAASTGISKIENDGQLRVFLENERIENYIIETFVEGDMYHIDGLYENGKVLFSHPSKYINPCLDFQSNKTLASYMLQFDNPMLERLNKAVEDILNSFPTPKNIIAFHAEIFHTPDDELVFCEIASRVGGAKIVDVIEHSTGINLLTEWIRAQCSTVKSSDYTFRNSKLAGWIIIPPQKGKLVNIKTDIPYEWVISCDIKEGIVGQDFAGANSSIDYVASLFVEGNSEKEVIERIEKVNEWFTNNVQWDFVDNYYEYQT